MDWAKRLHRKIKFRLAKRLLLLTLISLITISTTALAQSNQSSAPPVRFIPPQPPTQTITSGRQRGGSSRRGECPVANKPLSALVPASWKSSNKPGKNPRLTQWESVWGLTSVPHPTFWFYVPLPLTPKFGLEFIIQSEQGNNIYKTSLTKVQRQPSFIQVQMPSNAAPLEVGQIYHWFFVVDCDPDAPPVVEGWIQRTTLSAELSNRLKKASPKQRFALYATHGIWYDALNTLAQMRRINPNDRTLFLNWVELMNFIGMKEIANEPIN